MIKAKNFIKGSLSLLLSLLIVITMTIPMAFAPGPAVDGFEDNAGEGNTSGGETMGGGLGWRTSYQGYRVTLLSGNQLFPSLGSNAIKDILYSQPPSGALFSYPNRLGQSSGIKVTDLIGSGNLSSLAGLPPSLTSTMGANGVAVREYLLNGAAGGGGQGGSSGPQINWGTSTSSGGGGGTTSSSDSGSGNITADERADAQQIVNAFSNQINSYSM